MPLYEYVCEQDGSVVEVLRPMRQADEPVEDPEGKGRVFKRKLSIFATAGATAGTGSGRANLLGGNTCCPCGKNGPCGGN